MRGPDIRNEGRSDFPDRVPSGTGQPRRLHVLYEINYLLNLAGQIKLIRRRIMKKTYFLSFAMVICFIFGGMVYAQDDIHLHKTCSYCGMDRGVSTSRGC